MQGQRNSYVTRPEYLDLERHSETKNEYWNGEIYAMAGASPQHTLIAANIIISLGSQLKGRPCRVHTGDLRVKVNPTGLYTYPDIALVCGQPQYEDRQKDTLLKPTLVVEVLSKSTDATSLWQRSTKRWNGPVRTQPAGGCVP